MTVDVSTRFNCLAWEAAVKQIKRHQYHLDQCLITAKEYMTWAIAQGYQECESFECIECIYKPLLGVLRVPQLCSQRTEASGGCASIDISRVTVMRQNLNPVIIRNIR